MASVPLLLTSLPAHAQTAVALPDPSGATLFAVGLAGVVVGRWAAAKRPRD